MKTVEEMNPAEYANFLTNVSKFAKMIRDNIHDIRHESSLPRAYWERYEYDGIDAGPDNTIHVGYILTDTDNDSIRYKSRRIPECIRKDFNYFEKQRKARQ